MARVNLVYLSGNTTGGWVTFTSHLMRSLRAEGIKCLLYKRGKNTEERKRPFGYDINYRNVTELELLKLVIKDPTIIVACQKNYVQTAEELLRYGAFIVVHDPAEKSSRLKMKTKPWVVRKVGLKYLPEATFIRHPYVARSRESIPTTKRSGCISVSRIDFDKNTHILLDANRLGAKIEIRGFENRLYTRFKLCKDYPEWEQSVAAYPREHGAAFTMMLSKTCMADMSIIKGDGGGTQYTTLEAWDAECVPIIHREWIRKNDEMVPAVNCLTARDGKYLNKKIELLRDNPAIRDSIVQEGLKSMARHRPKIIVPKILEWLNQ